MFERVVVGVGRLSILIGAWMIVGGGGGTTVAEVDDLEITSCGIGDFVFLSHIPISFRGSPPERGGKRGELEWYGVRGFPNFLTICLFIPIVVVPIVRDVCRLCSRRSQGARI